jgi:type I restriction enzyme S subunit
MTTSEWRPLKLDELGYVGRGRSRHRPRNASFLYGGPYPFFQTGDIKAANHYLTKPSQTYSEAGLAQSKLWQPGTLCITIAANIAESAILGVEGCFPDSVVGFVPHPSKADVHFIKYYLEILKLRMQNISHGATQDNLSLDKLLSFDFLVPPLSVQGRIAGILSAYDDMIENSQRRIKILEEIARRFYREWFVNFRFPGHEGCVFVDSPLGEIPEGWEGSFGEIATIERPGVSPGEFPGESFEHFSIPAFDNGRKSTINQGSEILSNKYLIKGTCVLLSKLNPRIPRVWLIEPLRNLRSVCSTEFLVLQPAANYSREFIYCQCSSDEFFGRLQGLAIGTSTSHQRVKPESLLALPAIKPEASVVTQFTKNVAPILAMCEKLRFGVDNLRRTRDLLLPRLLSGQIDVEALPVPALSES